MARWPERAALTALLAAMAFGPAVAQRRPAAPPQDLFETFQRVCLEGRGELAPGSPQPARVQDIPGAGMRALNLLNPIYDHLPVQRFRVAMAGGRAIAANRVANAVHRLQGPRRAWLLTPAAAASEGVLGQYCVLIWEGRDYDAAALAQGRWLGVQTPSYPPAIMPQNFGWADASFEGQWLVTASLGNWTLMSALPGEAPAAGARP